MAAWVMLSWESIRCSESRTAIGSFRQRCVRRGREHCLLRIGMRRARRFLPSWREGENTIGRSVDITELSDGSLIISDDFAGLIYRISYDSGVASGQEWGLSRQWK